MTISQLANNITGSIRGLGTSLGLIAPDSRPNFVEYPGVGVKYENIQKSHWYRTPQFGNYAFGVQKVGEPLQIGSSTADFFANALNLFGSAGEQAAFTDFVLPVHPQEISQEEQFSVGIRPTQGGTIVKHSGNKYKSLTISGTTGVHPFKGITGADFIQGTAIFQPDELKFRSGYEVFQHFRQYIKSYHQMKSEGIQGKDDGKDFRMIFKNYKDWEFLYVEPLRFTMKRDAQKPLLYNYTIQFRVIGHVEAPNPTLNFLDQIDNALLLAKDTLQVARGILLKQQELIRSVAGEINSVLENLNRVMLSVKAAKGIAITWADVSSQVVANYLSQRDSVSLALKLSATSRSVADNNATFEESGGDPANIPEDPQAFSESLEQAATDVNAENTNQVLQNALENAGEITEQMTINDFPESAQAQITDEQVAAARISAEEINTIKDQVANLATTLADALGAGDPDFNSITGFTSTGVSDAAVATGLTDEQFEALYGLYELREALTAVLSSDELFDTNQLRFSRADSASGASTVGAGVFPQPPPGTTTRESIVPTGSSLEDIALLELGDSELWPILAELNSLRPPYITSASQNRNILRVRSTGFSDPTDIGDLQATYLFVVAAQPTPIGGWLGKAQTIAEYQGGPAGDPNSWRFRQPSEGEVVLDLSINQNFVYQDGAWSEAQEQDLNLENVLSPGDTILIPVGVATPEDEIPGPRDNPVTNELSSAEKSLSVDLKLNDSRDLALDPDGDLELSFGSTNGAQAVILKLLLERGELKKHPEIGGRFGIGQKIQDFGTIRSQVFNSLIVDPRIRDVRNINIARVGGTVRVEFIVFFNNIQDPVPVSIPV